MNVVDYENLEKNIELIKLSFKTSVPFPFVIIDNFAKPGLSQLLNEGFVQALAHKDPDAPKKHRHVLRKIGTMTKEYMTQLQQAFFTEINSEKFVSFLEYITGIPQIYADNDLLGGGLHEIYSGGFLNVHTDFNIHPKTNKQRTLNLILYLNQDWQEEYGGYLELWHPNMEKCAHKIAPIANRVVLFQTSEISFHGHPEPVKTPPGITRRSMAVYYYSDWPQNLQPREKTNYQLTPQQKQVLNQSINELIKQGLKNENLIVESLPNFEKKDVINAYRSLQKNK